MSADSDPKVFEIGIPDRFKGTFTNAHSNRDKKIHEIERNPSADGGYVVILAGGERWDMTHFSDNWIGEFKEAL